MTMWESLCIVRERWGEEVAEELFWAHKEQITLDDFLSKHCTTCGGNWGAWFLSGVKKLWPRVWEAIPDYMGSDCFDTICHLLHALGVWWEGQDEMNT